MKRRTFLGLTAALGAASATGACGVPSASDPIRLGNAPTQGPPDTDVQGPQTARDATQQSELIEFFLSAAAGANTVGGDRPDALDQAHNRMKEFFTEERSQQWQQILGAKVLVVRADIGKPMPTGEMWTINVTCVALGYLDDHGDIAPVPNATFQVTFTVVAVGSVGSTSQWRISALDRSPDAAPDLLLSETALKDWYETYPTYFWDPDVDTLVPELRYMPAAISDAKRPAEIVRWLTAGPSPWLNILKPLPQEIEVKDISPSPDGLHLTLNLSAKAANLERKVQTRFAVQVWWMLRRGTVELSIEGASTGIRIDADAAAGPGTGALKYNLAVRDEISSVEKFCILDRKARLLGEQQQPPLLTPVGNPNPNTEVSLAAVTRTLLNGALVRQDVTPGRSRLWTGTVINKDDSPISKYVPTAVTGKNFSRPILIGRPTKQSVMVVVDGVLMTVPTGTPDAEGVPVILPRGLTGAVSAVSVAPDGRRIAFIAGGQVIVAPMIFSDSHGIAISDTFRSIYTPLGSQVAVGWGDVVSLVVGGAPGPATSESLLIVPLSSAVQVAKATQSRIIEQISSCPGNASSANPTPLIMFESNNQAFNVFTGLPQLLSPPSSASPTPSVSASASPPTAVVASSPFFAD